MPRIPIIHQTDLFRPHEDPDDHFDLASVYSLHLSEHFDLKGIVIDHPPPQHDGVPDAPGIAMLNYLTGLDIPFVVGQAARYAEDVSGQDNRAVDFIIRTLNESSEPVCINTAGSCRDVAIAARQYPELFREKCRAILLNAGTGYAASESGDEIEYNVRLDEEAFLALFDLECPIFWLPCFERLGVGMEVHEHGTRYLLDQAGVLPSLSPGLQGYFAYMFARDRDPTWRRWLDPERFGPVITEQCEQTRPMWTTAGMLHLAGLDFSRVFVFEPVEVTRFPDGQTTWTLADADSNIRLFRIIDQDRYREEMPEWLTRLLLRLHPAGPS